MTDVTAMKRWFSGHTHSMRWHFDAFARPEAVPEQNPELADLKYYQDLFMYTAIARHVEPGAKVLEIGGGQSRLCRALSSRYEVWNLDKLEGEGAGPRKIVPLKGVRLVRDYIGGFSEELSENYFDVACSISVFEHVEENEANYEAIVRDINRVLCPGGVSLHALDCLIRGKTVWSNGILGYLHREVGTAHQPADDGEIIASPDTYTMSRAAYDRCWQGIIGQDYDEFGRPFSCNVMWVKKSA